MCSCKDNCNSLNKLTEFVAELRDTAYREGTDNNNTNDCKLLRLGTVMGFNKVLEELGSLSKTESVGVFNVSCK